MKTKLFLIAFFTTVLLASATVCSFAAANTFSTDKEKMIEQLREDMANRKTKITLYYKSTKEVTRSDINGWLDEAFAETGNPDEGDYLRWNYRKSSISISSKTDRYRQKENTITCQITYYTTAKQEEYVSRECDEILQEIDISSAKTNYDKVMRIYNYICENIDYDYTKGSSKNLLRYSAYGALYNGEAACLGYTTLFYRLLNEAGVENRIIYGMSDDEAHSWNIVKIGSLYYNTDVTWDAERNQYKWLLVGTKDFAQHTSDKEYLTSYFKKEHPIASNNCKLAAPSGLNLTTVASSGKPQLTWKAVNNADKYEVYRATSKNGTYKKMYTTKSTKYVNTSSTAGTTYYYKVKAIDNDNVKAASNYSGIKYITCDLAKPQEVRAVAKKGNGSPQVSWKAVEGAYSYEVYRATTKNGTYKKICTKKSASCTDTTAVKGTVYYYKVKAIKKNNSSANSAFSEYSKVTWK